MEIFIKWRKSVGSSSPNNFFKKFSSQITVLPVQGWIKGGIHFFKKANSSAICWNGGVQGSQTQDDQFAEPLPRKAVLKKTSRLLLEYLPKNWSHLQSLASKCRGSTFFRVNIFEGWIFSGVNIFQVWIFLLGWIFFRGEYFSVVNILILWTWTWWTQTWSTWTWWTQRWMFYRGDNFSEVQISPSEFRTVERCLVLILFCVI